MVGRGASDVNGSDVLQTPVDEHLLVASANRHSTRAVRGATYSSLSSFFKTRHFLRYAANAPEPIIAIGDDDIFVQPHMLLAHAIMLSEELTNDGEIAPFVSGAVEWYSWREETMVATGWERGAQGAGIKAQVSWRNCTPDGGIRTTSRDGEQRGSRPVTSHDRCFGPLPFSKGPLVLLSAPVVRWLNASALVARDISQAAGLAAGRMPVYRGTGSGRIPQDVSLGFWLSRHPTLQVVELQPFTAWCDRWKFVGDLGRLLIAHRVPWDRLAWLTQSTQRLWNDLGGEAKGKLTCSGPVCRPGRCAVARGQTACHMEIALPSPRADMPDFGCFACQCWQRSHASSDRTWLNGTCRFSRTSKPHLPQDCGIT